MENGRINDTLLLVIVMCVCTAADTLHARNLIRVTLENAVESVAAAVGTEKNLNVRPCHDLWMISRREFF